MSYFNAFWRRLRGRKGESGQTIAEFALTIPILLVTILGGLELGRMAGAQVALWHASREGVRTVTVWGTDADGVAAVKDAASWLNRDLITVTITPPEGQRHTGDRVTVNVNYDFQFVIRVPFDSESSLNSPMSAQVTGRVE